MENEKKSLWTKLGECKGILATAFLFDVLGIIPIINIISNMLFGVTLFAYFKLKKTEKKKDPLDDLFKIGLPMVLGSVIDSIISILPVCLGTTIYRMAAE